MSYIQATGIFNPSALSHYNTIAQGDDYMVPFSPARSSAASLKDSPRTPPNSGVPGDEVTVLAKEDTPVVAVAGEVGEADPKEEEAAAPTQTALTPDLSPTGAAGGGGSGGGVLLDGVTSTKEFVFSDDDESEEDDLGGRGRGTTRSEGWDQYDSNAKLNGGGGGGSADGGDVEKEETGSDTAAGAEDSDTAATAKGVGIGGSREEEKRKKRDRHRGRRRHSKSSNNDKTDYHRSSSGSSGSSGSDDDDGEKNKPVDERTRRRSSQREALLNPLGVPQGVQFDDDGSGGGDGGGEDDGSDGGNLTPPPARGKQRGVVGSACATPAPGAWAAPDFEFSSDDDLDIKFSSSEPSPGRSIERSLSRSPTAGNGGS